MKWQEICRLEQLMTGRGAAALLEGFPVALFRVSEDEVYAVSNIDPFTGASVISRGIVGDRDGEPVVASPLYKQVFSLRSGKCLDGSDEVTLHTFPVRRRSDAVEIGVN